MDRHNIESMLKEGSSVYAIAKALSRPVTTITREIKAHAVESNKGAAYRVSNRCASKCSAPSGTSVRIALTTKRGTVNSAASAIRIVQISWSRNANDWTILHSSAMAVRMNANAS